jgi:methylated-DNA-[protein]-cysteine S-methyltransferase
MLVRSTLPSPLGPLVLVARETELAGVYFADHAPKLEGAIAGDDHPVLRQAARELDEYFASERHSFTVPLSARGTPFQREVWQALATIPFGATWSYAELARVVGRARAVRAVGAANGRNPHSIIVPCHRVINAGGALGGYGGGLDRKRWLLAHERRGRFASPPSATASSKMC